MGRKKKVDDGRIYPHIYLSGLNPFPPQLKTYRKNAGLTLRSMCERMDKNSASMIANLTHFENMTEMFATNKLNLSETAIKYCRALGAKQIVINL
jgi:L-lactate utilization protein LutC